jgi:hypothetical protein
MAKRTPAVVAGMGRHALPRLFTTAMAINETAGEKG